MREKTVRAAACLRRRMTALAAALLLCVGTLSAGGFFAAEQIWAAADPTIELTGSGTDRYEMTLKVKNAQFNSLQLQLKYDTEKLTPLTEDGETAESLYDIVTPLAPMYSAAQSRGWMSLTGMSLDTKTGILDLTLYANADSRGVENGSDANGFVTVGETGEELISLTFQKKTGETLSEDSVTLYGSRGNPTGIILVCRNEAMSNDVEGLTNGAMVSIDGHIQPDTGDEYNFGTPKDETEGNEGSGDDEGGSGGNGSGSGGSGSGGNGSGSGSGSGGTTGGAGTTTGDQTGQEGQNQTGNGSAAGFKDVTGHWAQASIQKLSALGVVGGYPDGTFRPETGLSRGEFAQILTTALKLPAPENKTLPFTDTRDHWAKNAVAAVWGGGYASGTTENTFGVEESITREQLVTILCRAKGIAPKDEIAPASGIGQKDGDVFTDDSQISSWARGYVYAAKAAGILSGYEDGSFGPQRGMTRGEMAYVTARILE